MAITFPSVFQSTIADDPGDLAAGLLTPSRFNSGCSVAGLGTNQLLYSTGATTLAQSANLTYSDTLVNSGPGLKVGTSGTSSGVTLGYYGVGGFGAIWFSGLTPSGTNYAMALTAGDTYLNGVSSTNSIFFQTGNNQRGFIGGTAGQGLGVTAGTATTDVQALSATQTWNNAAVAFTAEKTVITDTASAAGSLAKAIYGGAAGTTVLEQLDKSGNLTVSAAIQLDAQNALGFGTVAGGNTRGGIRMSADGTMRIFNHVDGDTSVGVVFGGTIDTSIYKISAGLIGIGTGSAGSFAGSLKLSNLITTGAAASAGANTVAFGGTTQTTIGANGGASALTALPLGYITVNVGGTAAIIPYYNA